MGKSHRDNHRARKKRGAAAFKAKGKRREKHLKTCVVCGGRFRTARDLTKCEGCGGASARA